MIITSKDSKLTPKNIVNWYSIWEKDRKRLEELQEFFLNKRKGKSFLKIPMAKRLVVTAVSATLGDGIIYTSPDTLAAAQKATFDEVVRLYKKQSTASHDKALQMYASVFGRSYELVYMSDDVVPVPKVVKYSATHAFVVGDNTAEKNGMYGFICSHYTKGDTPYVEFTIYDKFNKYIYELPQKDCNPDAKLEQGDAVLKNGKPHKIDRMPLTEHLNNEEEQGDFEQATDLILDRTIIHDINMMDEENIPKNVLAARNIQFAGNTVDEKRESLDKARKLKLIEYEAEDTNPNPLLMMSKASGYGSVDILGKDITDNIYDTTMIPNLTDDQFAGNSSGVALEYKLAIFKWFIALKDEFIERTARRRFKEYVYCITRTNPRKFAYFDAGDVGVKIERNWATNLEEVARIIQTLSSTGMFSDRTLVSMVPKVDYDDEVQFIEEEAKMQAQITPSTIDPLNGSIEEIIRQMAQSKQGSIADGARK